VKLEEHLNKLQEKFKALQIDNKGLQAKNEDLRENQAYLEDKLAKMKKRVEYERVKWENDRENEITARKERNKLLKADIQEFEAFLQRVSDEKKDLASSLSHSPSPKKTNVQDYQAKTDSNDPLGTSQDLSTLEVIDYRPKQGENYSCD
jgi:predicted RNase H-like nuclease (RuvC/YqgF family)